jgi:hypothetical protein
MSLASLCSRRPATLVDLPADPVVVSYIRIKETRMLLVLAERLDFVNSNLSFFFLMGLLFLSLPCGLYSIGIVSQD